MRENSVHRGIVANDDPLGFEVPFVAMYLVAMYILVFIYLFVFQISFKFKNLSKAGPPNANYVEAV